MRFLLLFTMWVFAMSPFLQAQSINDFNLEMEKYVQEQMNTPAPNEEAQAKINLEDEVREGFNLDDSQEGISDENGVKQSRLNEIILTVRRAYWEKTFRLDNRDLLLEIRGANRLNPLKASGPLANPDLTADCPIHVAILIDQSTSLNATERAQIQAGLVGFLSNMEESGNLVSILGMGDGSPNAPVIQSGTVTYSAGVTSTAQANWVNNTLFTYGTPPNTTFGAANWGSGLAAVNGLAIVPDLAIVISDGANGDDADYALACQSADALKSNTAANDGNGTHLFVIASDDNTHYRTPGGTFGLLLPFINGIVENPSMEAANISLAELSTNDYIGFLNGNFAQVQGWLDILLVDCTPPCELVVDCSNIRNQRLECYEDLPNGNPNLPIIVSSCGSVSVTWSDFTTAPPGPGSVLRVYTVTDSDGNTATCSQTFQINGVGWAIITDIANVKNPCLEAEICFSGKYRLCKGVSEIPPSVLVFKRNGIEVASFPVDLEPDGSFKECISKKDLLMAGLETGTGYDVCIRINTSWSWGGSTIVSPPFVSGTNNDFKFGAYAAEVISLPECVKEGEVFSITVEIDGLLSNSDIEAIYSFDNLYTYVNHFIVTQTPNSTIVVIRFISNTCTCEGEMLTFDIVIEGCSCPIWVMTENIPCCATPCKETYVKDWETSDCYFYNGCLARDFTLIVSSPDAITGISAVGDNITCTTTIIGISITPGPGAGNYTVTGTMKFDDPTCTGHAQIDMSLDTKNGCCLLTHNFSFPGGCKIPEECNIKPPTPQLIYDGNPPAMTVSLGFPLGTNVTITNNNTNSSVTTAVQKILCPPFSITTTGTVNGNSCAGIVFKIPEYDCEKEVEGQSSMYSYTITVGDCVWVITGDYCDVITIYRQVPNTGGEKDAGGSSEDRSGEVEDAFATDEVGDRTISVYPNPIQSSDVLNFDFSRLSVAVKTIRITDMSGKVIEDILPEAGVEVFSHSLSNDLSQGVYFVIFGLEDGSVESKKLISLQ